MALIKCKECDGQVSDKATTCPHCGINLPTLTKEQLEDVKKHIYFAQGRIWGGVAFFSGVILVLWPIIFDMSDAAISNAWKIGRWIIGGGLFYYVISEIERNLYKKKGDWTKQEEK